MSETQKNDQDRLIDQTLSLFQNAIAEAKTIVPSARLGRAVKPIDVSPSEPPAQEKRAASLAGQAVSFVRAVAGFVPRATETASPLVKLSVAEQYTEKLVGDTRPDPSVDQALSMVAIVPIDEPTAAELASPPSLKTAKAAVLSLPPFVDKPTSKEELPLKRPTQVEPPTLIEQTSEKPVGNARSDPLVDHALPLEHPAQEEPPSLIGHALSLVNKVAISEHKAILVEEIVISEHKAAALPRSLNTTVAAVLSLRRSVDEPASKDVLPIGRSTQEKPPFLTGHALSLVNKVTISEHKAILVDEIVISEYKGGEIASPSVQLSVAEQFTEKAVGDARSDTLVDRALSMVAIVPIDEPKAVEAASPSAFNTAEAAVLSLRQSVDKLASTDVLPLELPAQEEPPSLIGHALSTVVAEALTALNRETAPQEILMKQFSPKERLDMDRAEILRRVAIFRKHQLRFQHEREEYYATTMANIQATRWIPGTGMRDN
jgi:hypothetical protein